MKQAFSRTFRLFVSSTFSDLKEERNALIRFVFPKLRALCESRGYKFQVMDLRWGVSNEASADQQTVRICLEEIARCQGTEDIFSPRPNFIVLLGDRYGWKPLPALIPAVEFETLISHLTYGEVELAKKWYRLDENAVPAEYVLQARRTPPYDDYEQWAPIEHILLESFRKAAELTDLPEEFRRKYGASATEQEIWNGALDNLKVPDAAEHVFAFYRNIREPETVEASLADPRPEVAKAAKDLIDTKLSGPESYPGWDRKEWEKLRQLKTMLERRIGSTNVWQYDAEWENGKLDLRKIGEPQMPEDCSVTRMDLSPGTLCGEVWLRLSKVILRQMDALDELAKDPVEMERTIHNQFRKDRMSTFRGRKEALDSIIRYLQSGTTRPLIIYGVPGSGKTSLMARAADLASEIYPDSVIDRYIGATPAASEIAPLLGGLCKEISRRFNGEEFTVPGDIMKLINDFPERLKLADAGKPIILFIDALDQLGDTNDGCLLDWLPRNLPPHVKIVVSTLSDEENQCLKELRLSAVPADLVEIMPMSAVESEMVFTTWMTLATPKRILTENQSNEILKKCLRNGLPLYMKLVFEEARRWHSYDGVPDNSLADDVPGMIRCLFRYLSKPEHHSPIVVERTLVYLAVSRFGLSEDEILDLLWRDDESREDFMSHNRYHRLPEGMNTMPPVIWSRLFFDLRPYLVEREISGVRLLDFYHRQFRGVVFDEYFTGEADRMKAHRGLARCLEAFSPGYVRTLSEIVYHLSQAHEDVSLIRLMTGDFPRKKLARFGSVAEISQDYATAIESCGRLNDPENGVRFAVNRLDLHSEAAALLKPGLALLLARQATLSDRLSEVRRAEMLLQECVHEPAKLSCALSDLAAGLVPGPERTRLLHKSKAILMSAGRNRQTYEISQAAVHLVSSCILSLDSSPDFFIDILRLQSIDERDRQLIVALNAIDLWRRGQKDEGRSLLPVNLPMLLPDETLETAGAVLENLREPQAAGNLVLHTIAIYAANKSESKFYFGSDRLGPEYSYEPIPWLQLKNTGLFSSIFLAARAGKHEWIRSVIDGFRGSWFTRVTGMLAVRTMLDPHKNMSPHCWLLLARLSKIDSREWEAVGCALSRSGLITKSALRSRNFSFLAGLLQGADPTSKVTEAIQRSVQRRIKRRFGANDADLIAVGNAAVRSANAKLANDCLMAVIHQRKKWQSLRNLSELFYGPDALIGVIGMFAAWIAVFGWRNLVSLIVLGVAALCAFFGLIYIVNKLSDRRKVHKIPNAEAFIAKYVNPVISGDSLSKHALKRRFDLLTRLLVVDNVLAGASSSGIEMMNQLLKRCSTSGIGKERIGLTNAVAVAALRAGHHGLAEHATKLTLEDKYQLEIVDRDLLAGAWLGENISRACAIGGMGRNIYSWVKEAVRGASTHEQKRKILFKGIRLLSAETEYETGETGILKLLQLSGKKRLLPAKEANEALKYLRIPRFISIPGLSLVFWLLSGVFLFIAILAGAAVLLFAIPLRWLVWPIFFSIVRSAVYFRLRQSGFLARTKTQQ